MAETPQTTGDAYKLHNYPFAGGFAYASAYRDAAGNWRLAVDTGDDYPFPKEGTAERVPYSKITLVARWKDMVLQVEESSVDPRGTSEP